MVLALEHNWTGTVFNGTHTLRWRASMMPMSGRCFLATLSGLSPKTLGALVVRAGWTAAFWRGSLTSWSGHPRARGLIR